MPNGYRVSRVHGCLEPGNALDGPAAVAFTTDTVVGSGKALFTNATYNSTFFTSGSSSGTFVLGSDGHVYFDPDFPVELLNSFSSAEVLTTPYSAGSDRITPCATKPFSTADGRSKTALLLDGTSVTYSEIEAIICFTEGTLIQTPHGERRIETLGQGDTVVTLDNGPQKIRWVGKKTVRATGALAPISFQRGVVGNHRELLVSPHHRMLVTGHRAQRLFGDTEVLIPARRLVDDFNVTTRYGGMVTYVHMLFDRHEVIIANGAPSESFYPGGEGLDTLSEPSREELFRLFPQLRTDANSFGPLSRTCVDAAKASAFATP